MTHSREIIIATRGSQLALWQANHVANLLTEKGFEPKLNIIKTQGDKILHKPLYDVGGKGLFIKELEHALLNKEAHIAVHSLKDVPAALAPDFRLGCILPRHDVHDALIVQDRFHTLTGVPIGHVIPPEAWNKLDNLVVGTSSLRRSHTLKALNPHIETASLRGNVDTRLAKLVEGKDFDAIILAAASLERLELKQNYSYFILSSQEFVPSAGQGALAIECLQDFAHLNVLEELNCQLTADAVNLERRVVRELGASCQTPIGCLAVKKERQWFFNFRLIATSGESIYFQKTSEQLDDAFTEVIFTELRTPTSAQILTAMDLKTP